MDDAAAPLRLIRLGPDVVRYPRIGRPGPLTGVPGLRPGRRSDSPALEHWPGCRLQQRVPRPQKDDQETPVPLR